MPELPTGWTETNLGEVHWVEEDSRRPDRNRGGVGVMIWKRRDAEFTEQASSQNPLRSPRLRVSNFRTLDCGFLFQRKDAKTQRRKDFDSALCVFASLRLGVFIFSLGTR